MPVHRPLIVGEVLFDCFPDGRKVAGGAPFNVAWNLQGLGLAPALLTAVGDDAEGHEIRSLMSSWGMDTTGVQTSTRFRTGRVDVSVRDGQPLFDILAPRAWDDINFPEGLCDDGPPALLYVGSLACRSEPSRTTISRLIDESDCRRFVDVNIRDPWFDVKWLSRLLNGAEWVKLNIDELARITGYVCSKSKELETAAHQIQTRFDCKSVFVTSGSEGAYVVGPNSALTFAESPKADPMVDAVGAGDAFAAEIIRGLLHGQAPGDTLTAAVRLASRTCTIRGATTDRSAHYQPDGTSSRKS